MKLLNTKEKQKTIYFREGLTFDVKPLDLRDGCIVLKENDKITKAWGHSPKALLPLDKQNTMVQLVNARDGNPLDPFGVVNDKERFTTSSIKVRAKEVHNSALVARVGTNLTMLQLIILGIAVFLFLIGGIVFAWSRLGGA